MQVFQDKRFLVDVILRFNENLSLSSEYFLVFVNLFHKLAFDRNAFDLDAKSSTRHNCANSTRNHESTSSRHRNRPNRRSRINNGPHIRVLQLRLLLTFQGS
jgi:hypothetical protein